MDATVLLRTEDSDDRVGIVEVTVPAGWPGPPLHHHAFDEAFYVLEGELTFQLGDELATAGPGSLTFAPSGSHHTLPNRGNPPARHLLLCPPRGVPGPVRPHAVCRPGGFEPRCAPGPRQPYPETVVVGPCIGERAS